MAYQVLLMSDSMAQNRELFQVYSKTRGFILNTNIRVYLSCRVGVTCLGVIKNKSI